MDQRLGRLAFYLLDPRSDDGLFEWNFFDDVAGDEAPSRKMKTPSPIVTERIFTAAPAVE